jgi:hypothetical protein
MLPHEIGNALTKAEIPHKLHAFGDVAADDVYTLFRVERVVGYSRRFLWLSVLKMISSTISFSMISQLASALALNIFLIIGLSQGFWKF